MEINDESLHTALLEAYAREHSSSEDPVLARLNRETHLKSHMPQMLSGHPQGLFLQMISSMIKPARILEIGTFTGYSAICLASGLQENGHLDTIEVNPEMEETALRYFSEAGVEEKIRMHTGTALEIIPLLTGNFDLVFIDADKEHYCDYFDLVIERLNPNGWILADNTLWYGKVIQPGAMKERETAGIVRFNEYVRTYPGVQCLLLPVRDGLTLIRKISR